LPNKLHRCIDQNCQDQPRRQPDGNRFPCPHAVISNHTVGFEKHQTKLLYRTLLTPLYASGAPFKVRSPLATKRDATTSSPCAQGEKRLVARVERRKRCYCRGRGQKCHRKPAVLPAKTESIQGFNSVD